MNVETVSTHIKLIGGGEVACNGFPVKQLFVLELHVELEQALKCMRSMFLQGPDENASFLGFRCVVSDGGREKFFRFIWKGLG